MNSAVMLALAHDVQQEKENIKTGTDSVMEEHKV
jgi:hypothetical protein